MAAWSSQLRSMPAGTPWPFGVQWVEADDSFNFALYFYESSLPSISRTRGLALTVGDDAPDLLLNFGDRFGRQQVVAQFGE